MSDESKTPVSTTGAEHVLDEAERLIWALLDEQIDRADTTRLSQLIHDDAAVRTLYLECVQLHVDLREHFGKLPVDNGGGVVLANLLPGPADACGVPRGVE